MKINDQVTYKRVNGEVITGPVVRLAAGAVYIGTPTGYVAAPAARVTLVA